MPRLLTTVVSYYGYAKLERRDRRRGKGRQYRAHDADLGTGPGC